MEKQPYRILQVVTIMNRGGAEAMVMNHYRAIDRSKVQFDFLVNREERGAYDDEIEDMGGRIFRSPAIRPWTYFSYFRWLDGFFKKHAIEFKAVHAHLQENSGFALHYAKKYGIANRLATSHIAMPMDYKYPFRKFADYFLQRSVSMRLACGKDAGAHMYGARPFEVLPNAINTDVFAFDLDMRIKKRKELGIEDNSILIGHVGRFCIQKNHKFVVKLFAEYLKRFPQAYLVLVGVGPLKESIQRLVKSLNIVERVKFLCLRDDVAELMQAFDVFFMPSRFEGLPVSVIEAQAAGLSCVISDTIDHTVDVTGNVEFVSFVDPDDVWIDAIYRAASAERKDTSKKIIASGYDVKQNTLRLLNLYGIPIEEIKG